LEAKRCRMAYDADLNRASEVADIPALGQWRRGGRYSVNGARFEFLFKLDPQALNLSAMLPAKARDARFRNDHAVLREQILNLRERRILSSQRQHR